MIGLEKSLDAICLEEELGSRLILGKSLESAST